MRMRKKHWTEQELQTNPYIIKQATEKKGNWSAYFENDNDIYVEIGCGKGNFLRRTIGEKSADLSGKHIPDTGCQFLWSQ